MMDFHNTFEIHYKNLTKSIIHENSFDQRVSKAIILMFEMIEKNHEIDQDLRNQLNYILDNKGKVNISSIHKNFNINKFTLRNHFIERVGLTAKEIAKIWRFNNFLSLLNQSDPQNLTGLTLEAGYYDQSHGIKDFRSYLYHSPKNYLNNDLYINISKERISRRFAGYYDPY